MAIKFHKKRIWLSDDMGKTTLDCEEADCGFGGALPKATTNIVKTRIGLPTGTEITPLGFTLSPGCCGGQPGTMGYQTSRIRLPEGATVDDLGCIVVPSCQCPSDLVAACFGKPPLPRDLWITVDWLVGIFPWAIPGRMVFKVRYGLSPFFSQWTQISDPYIAPRTARYNAATPDKLTIRAGIICAANGLRVICGGAELLHSLPSTPSYQLTLHDGNIPITNYSSPFDSGWHTWPPTIFRYPGGTYTNHGAGIPEPEASVTRNISAMLRTRITELHPSQVNGFGTAPPNQELPSGQNQFFTIVGTNVRAIFSFSNSNRFENYWKWNFVGVTVPDVFTISPVVFHEPGTASTFAQSYGCSSIDWQNQTMFPAGTYDVTLTAGTWEYGTQSSTRRITLTP